MRSKFGKEWLIGFKVMRKKVKAVPTDGHIGIWSHCCTRLRMYSNYVIISYFFVMNCDKFYFHSFHATTVRILDQKGNMNKRKYVYAYCLMFPYGNIVIFHANQVRFSRKLLQSFLMS